MVKGLIVNNILQFCSVYDIHIGIFKGNIISNFLQSDDITYSMIVDYLHKDPKTEKGEQ